MKLVSATLKACLLASALLLTGCATTPRDHVADGVRTTLALLESTDVHSNVLSYDYYQLNEDTSLGFERLATLVREARQQYPNTMLFDAGDTIQGTALADLQARAQPLACAEELAMYKAMDGLGYDAGTIGNHEFNYGLPFLSQVTGAPMAAAGTTSKQCQGPGFPLVLSNVFDAKSGNPLFAPYLVLDRNLDIVRADGSHASVPIRIGVLGFTPPSILEWDKTSLEGKVTTMGLVEAAKRYLPELRAKHVDLVIAISHGGIDTSPYSSAMENANWYLAQVLGIDALLLGHSHQPFPDPDNPESRFASMPDVDNVRGFIHGKPAVMGNFWGKSLGIIELGLVSRDGRWQIDPAATHSEVRNIKRPDGSMVAANPAIEEAVRDEHLATIKYVSTPIGDSNFAMTSYFAEVGDVTALQPVNMAQREYAERYIGENLPALKGVPVLSAAAPFKSGFGGATDYTDIPTGPLAIRNAADLYLYPNTLAAVKVSGAGLKAWLELSAHRFNRIDPAKTEAQELINRKFSGYNFDVIQGGIHYFIDVTRPEGDRIRDLRYRQQPVEPQHTFVVVTNNYRASGGGHFPGMDGSNIVIDSPDMNRNVLIDWVRDTKHLRRADNGSDRSWHFAAARTRGDVVFTSAARKVDIAHAAGLGHVHWLKDIDNGMAIYAIRLDQQH
ncbi:MAG: bifunctional 2',3'-cyclic-nucleotide 2'-phosphodiesterase/3'-nucleotidase [Dokdonella sp.]